MQASVFVMKNIFVTTMDVNLAFRMINVHSEAAKVVPQAPAINRQDNVHHAVLDIGAIIVTGGVPLNACTHVIRFMVPVQRAIPAFGIMTV